MNLANWFVSFEEKLKSRANLKLAFVILAILFWSLRLYHVNAPVLDRHSWNQTSGASMAMNIYKDPSSFFRPDINAATGDTDSTVNGQEFPIFFGLIALGYQLVTPQIWVARIIGIGIAFLGWIYFYRLLRLEENRTTSLFILVLYTVNSHNWFFDRAINSDTGMVTFMLASLFYFIEYRRTRSWPALILLLVTTTLAGLFKPYGLAIGFSFMYLVYKDKSWTLLKDIKLYAVGIVVLVTNLSWVFYTEYYLPSSVSIGSDLGFNFKDLFSLNSLNIMQQRIFDQITTQFLMLFCIFAIFSKKISNKVLYSLLVSNICYFIIIIHGNLGHNYYQLPFTPTFIGFSGLGLLYWMKLPAKKLNPKFKLGIIIFILVGYIAYSAKKTSNHLRLSMGPKYIGDYIQATGLADGQKLLVLENSGTRYHEVLYYANRKGWIRRQVSHQDLDWFKQKGIEIVAVHYEESYFSNDAIMKPINEMLEPIWIGEDCRNSYGDECLMGVYKFK